LTGLSGPTPTVFEWLVSLPNRPPVPKSKNKGSKLPKVPESAKEAALWLVVCAVVSWDEAACMSMSMSDSAYDTNLREGNDKISFA
jgi:hypothetical protein